MEWSIKNLADASAHSGRRFEPGERIVCFVFKDAESGELSRADIFAEETEVFEVPGPVLGRWGRVLKAPGEKRESGRERLASAEEFFLSLYTEGGAAAEDEAEALKQMLALFLERKRVLRPLGPRQKTGFQRYRHVRRKEEYAVPVAELSPDTILRIRETLGEILAF